MLKTTVDLDFILKVIVMDRVIVIIQVAMFLVMEIVARQHVNVWKVEYKELVQVQKLVVGKSMQDQ